jgi:hypothetical protein
MPGMLEQADGRRRVGADGGPAGAVDAGLLEADLLAGVAQVILWSRSTLVTIAASASNTFTASSRPPRPTSRMATSTPASMNCAIAPRVPNSK